MKVIIIFLVSLSQSAFSAPICPFGQSYVSTGSHRYAMACPGETGVGCMCDVENVLCKDGGGNFHRYVWPSQWDSPTNCSPISGPIRVSTGAIDATIAEATDNLVVDDGIPGITESEEVFVEDVRVSE